MRRVPASLGFPVSYRQWSWLQLAERAWGSEYRQPDHGIYQFSNGRRFDSTDMYQTGIYRRGIYSFLVTESGEEIVTESGEEIEV